MGIGTLYFNGGGMIDGVYTVAPGAALNFNAGNFTAGVATINGPGPVSVTGGTVTFVNDIVPNLQVTGGTVALSPGFQGGTITNLTLAGGTLSGSNAVTGTLTCGGFNGPLLVTAGGTVNWITGDANGPLTVASNGTLNLAGSATKYILNPMTNMGLVTWTGSGGLSVYNNLAGYRGGIWNLAGGVFDIATDVNISCACYGNEFFNNLGTVQKSAGSGTTYVGVTFNNSGTAQALAGTLNFNNGGTIGGVFAAAAGTALNFTSGAFSADAATINGPGAVSFTGGSLALLNHEIVNLQLTGGTVTPGPGFEGGSITSLTIAGSALSGANTVAGTLTWTGGTINGPLRVENGGALNIGGATTKYVQAALTNAGTITWTGGSLNIYNNNAFYSGAIWNLAGAVFNIATDQNINCACYGEEFINNQGTFEKTAGPGTTYVGVLFTNRGTVQALQGTLNFNNGGRVDGAYSVDADAALNFTGGAFSAGAAAVSGPGPANLTGGTMTLLSNAIPNLQLTGGTVVVGTNFEGGTITNLTLAGSTLSGRSSVGGTLTWTAGAIAGPLTVRPGGFCCWVGARLNMCRTW